MQVYTFSGGQLKLVQNKQFNNLKNQYEITFSPQSEIRAVVDDTNIKNQTYSLVKINTLNDLEINSTVDLVAVVRDSSDVVEVSEDLLFIYFSFSQVLLMFSLQIVSKTGNKTLQKRDLTLIDDTLTEVRYDGNISHLFEYTVFWVRLTLWGEKAIQLDKLAGRIIALKGVKVSELVMLYNTKLTYNTN